MLDCDGDEAEWSPEEDAFLVELKGIGTAREEISEYLPGRSNHSCHRRYLDLHAKWSEELKMKLSVLRTTKIYTGESEPRSNTCEQDPGTIINPAQVPLNPDTNPEGCLSATQVASSIATLTPVLDDMDTLSRHDSQSEKILDGSDKSEYSILDYAAFYDSSRFSILESAAADQLLNVYDKWSRISTFCNASFAASKPTDTSEASQTLNASSGSNTSPPSSSSSSSSPAGISTSVAAPTSQAFPKSTPTLKRKREKDGDSDDEDQPRKPRVQKRKRVEEGEKRLACPFQKRYHPGHLFCGEDRATRGFQTIAQVKQHVTRSHLHPPLHCTRCKAKFDDVSEMDSHKNATPPCEELPYSDETKLLWNMKLVKSINARVNEKIDLDKQWFSVWDLLFPDAKRPASCRVESDELCKHLLDLQQFVVGKGASIVRTSCQHRMENGSRLTPYRLRRSFAKMTSRRKRARAIRTLKKSNGAERNEKSLECVSLTWPLRDSSSVGHLPVDHTWPVTRGTSLMGRRRIPAWALRHCCGRRRRPKHRIKRMLYQKTFLAPICLRTRTKPYLLRADLSSRSWTS